MTTTVLLAGATGDLGLRISRELLSHDVHLRILTRSVSGPVPAELTDPDRIEVVAANYDDLPALRAAAEGADVVVSAISGTRPVIVDAQRALLRATVEAGVPRFIPSDYSADYRRVTPGTNRNFELRREFAADVDATQVRATSIMNGMFTDLLTGEAPLVLFGRKRVLYWSSPDQVLDFTTKDDTARTVAHVALDDDAPRVVEVAGDSVTAREIAQTMTRLTGERFALQWAGTTKTLSAMASIGRRLAKNPDETFPAWQGMQYFVSMFSGQARLRHLDNGRYGDTVWTTTRDVLEQHLGSIGKK